MTCLQCDKPLVGKQTKYCCHDHAVQWRNKNVYRYKFTYSHRNSSQKNFLKTLLNRKGRNKTLTVEFLENLLERQNGLCAISGVGLTFIAGQGRVNTNVSLDQIEPGKGYIEGNIQLVCRIVNTMKYDNSLKEFIDWCKIISNRFT